MDTSGILFVGVKGHVVAIGKNDGRLIWKTQLKEAILSIGDRFVTLLVDGGRVYAHTGGELFCLDAATGRQLWTNRLEGLGYDIASLAVDGAATPLQGLLARRRKTAQSDGGDGGGDGGD